MKNYEMKSSFKEGEVRLEKTGRQLPAKRVNIVQVKLIRENSMLYKGRKVRSPHDGYDLIKEFLGDVDREHFVVLCLDTKNQPTCIQTVHIGSLNSSIVHPREVFKSAILSNSDSILIAHNHPSNVTTPSSEDLEVTERLKEAGRIIGIGLLDHLIICENSFLSLKEKGYIG